MSERDAGSEGTDSRGINQLATDADDLRRAATVLEALSDARNWLVRQAEADAPPRGWRAREELIAKLEAAIEDVAAKAAERRAEHAEAALADSLKENQDLRKQVEATRQALAEIAEGRCECGGKFVYLPSVVQTRCDNCDKHKGFTSSDPAVIARRALADTGGDT